MLPPDRQGRTTEMCLPSPPWAGHGGRGGQRSDTVSVHPQAMLDQSAMPDQSWAGDSPPGLATQEAPRPLGAQTHCSPSLHLFSHNPARQAEVTLIATVPQDRGSDGYHEVGDRPGTPKQSDGTLRALSPNGGWPVCPPSAFPGW